MNGDESGARLSMPFEVEHSVQQGVSVNGETRQLTLTPTADAAAVAHGLCTAERLDAGQCAVLVRALRRKQREAFCTVRSGGAEAAGSAQVTIEGSW